MVPRRTEEVFHSTYRARSPPERPKSHSLTAFVAFLTARPAGRSAFAGFETRIALEAIAVTAASRRDPSGLCKRALYGSGDGGRQFSRWVKNTGRQIDGRSRICGGADGVGYQIEHRWVLTSASAQALFLSFSFFPPPCLPLWLLPCLLFSPHSRRDAHLVAQNSADHPKLLKYDMTRRSYSLLLSHLRFDWMKT